MKSPGPQRIRRSLAAAAAVALAALGLGQLAPAPESDPTSVIVQAADMTTAAAAVRAVGGRISHELGVIDAVAARLTARQLAALRSAGFAGRVYENRTVHIAGKPGGGGAGAVSPPVVRLVQADQLHGMNIDGRGVGVAVLDTGHYSHASLNKDPDGRVRVLANYDAILDQEATYNVLTETDASGHGAHVSSVTLDSTNLGTRRDPAFRGVAPAAKMVVARAFDENGRGTYADVIRGIDWVVRNADRHYIRVLNCSFSAPVRSHYWEDPLNQAVMRAWKAGLVVVVSAGNSGPQPMSVGVPGNVPYVITVGALTDRYTPDDGSDDRLASFSATGPTYEGFVKPDVVAPGGHVQALMKNSSQIALAHPEFHDGGAYFVMSGTSQSAAVVSGIAALILQNDASYSPNDVKCALMASARAAKNPDGSSPYSVFQQGAGLVNAYAAVFGGHRGCANGGLDVAKDLAGIEHYGGPASQDANGNYYLMDQTGSGTTWNGGYGSTGGYPWSSGYPWSNGYPWSSGYPWSNGYTWSNGYPWSNSYSWSAGLAEPASINVWVPQE